MVFTGGYKIAFPIMAYIIAYIYKQSKKNKMIALSIGMLLSLFVCYLIGTTWFSLLSGTGFYESLTLCVFPFVLFDLIKIVLAIALSMILRKTAMRTFNNY